MGTTTKIPSTEFTTAGTIEYTQEHESGWKRWTMKKKVVASASANVTVGTVPANSVLDGWAAKAQAVGGSPITTGTHLGLGITGTLNKFDEVADNSIDDSDTYVGSALSVTPVAQDAQADLLLASTNGSGTAAGSFTGTWDVIVTGRQFIGFGS